METFSNVEACVEETLRRVGRKIVLGIPLGIGKPNQFVNALYQRAKAEPAIDLTILTALSLNKPFWKSDLERRFKEPLVARLYPDYPDLDYLTDLQRGRLAANVRVREFYLNAGQFLNNPVVQRHYVSTNYTHVAREALAQGINVFAQMVAAKGAAPSLSLSSNPDLTLDLVAGMRERQAAGQKIVVWAQVNEKLPFMDGPATVGSDFFDGVIVNPAYNFHPFAIPRLPIPAADYLIGLHASLLVRDGGTLQLGIGSEADAIAYFLRLRHENAVAYEGAVKDLGLLSRWRKAVDGIGGTGAFRLGLYGATELFMPGFLDLLEAGVIHREVDGAFVHACFFLGNPGFYERLRKMDAAMRRRIQMTRVSFVNELYGEEELKRRQRVQGRFINNAMKVTLSGAVVSDTLADHKVVSGVGGQYNFVAMAHELVGARAIILIHATHQSGRRLESNIVWDYGDATIPRHLRDVVVSEYGIADLRGRSDEEVIKALLQICDSRFQAGLLARAKRAGKLDSAYEIPAVFRKNLPTKISAQFASLQKAGLCPPAPFGTDFSPEELRLIPAFQLLQGVRKNPLLVRKLLGGWRGIFKPHEEARHALERLQLEKPRSLRERVIQKLVLAALAAS